MRKTIIILTFLLPIQLLGQTNICKSDSTAIGQLINKLMTEGATSITIRKADKKNATKYLIQATRLCEHHYTTIDSLDKLIKTEEMIELINCDNGTLTATGFIILCNRTNDKEKITKRLFGIIQDRYRIISNNCSDAVQVLSLGQYCLNLLTRENGLIRNQIKLDKADLEKIKGEIKLQEEKYWTE
jgi:hypothetical protein